MNADIQDGKGVRLAAGIGGDTSYVHLDVAVEADFVHAVDATVERWGRLDCVINNADLGGVVITDVISYFVIAQDTVGNVGSNPGGATATDVNTVSVPPAVPNSYTIVPALSGSLNVGAAETYTSLTNAGGLFEAINGGALTSNLVINLTSDLVAELGTNALNQWAEDGVGGYTMLIKPFGAPPALCDFSVQNSA